MTDPDPIGGARAAKAFTHFLFERASTEPFLPDDYKLPHDIVEEAVASFMGTPPVEAGAKAPRTVGYKEPAYWFEHARITADLMSAFARRHGKNRTLYAQLGRLHDADYLAHPHNTGARNQDIHPYPLARFLSDRGVPAIVCLAIMEHAGYIGRGDTFSCPMAAALSACDDLATFLAVSFESDLSDQKRRRHGAILSEEARALASGIAEARFMIDAETSCPARILTRPEHFINHTLRLAMEGDFAFDS